jgi:hypothetical protein
LAAQWLEGHRDCRATLIQPKHETDQAGPGLITEPSIGPGSPNSVDLMAVSARIENLASWFAASVLVAGIIDCLFC